MVSQQFVSRVWLRALKGASVSLGIAAVMVTNGANAISVPDTLSQALRVAQSSSGDVTVPTESDSGSSPASESDNSSPSKATGNVRFTCEVKNGQYTVMYHPESQPGQAYAWANPTALGSGWTPERRCNEISRRLESYRPDGLQEMKTGVENGYNIVCVTTQKAPGCRIVLTVPPGQDPVLTRDRVFQNLTVADSGQQTQGVNTLVSGSDGKLVNQIGELLNIPLPGNSGMRGSRDIDLRPFLDRADGGTAGRLVGGSTDRPGRRLNPNRFR